MVVVVILVCILVLTALNRLWELRTTVERATMEYQVGALRSALAMHFAALIVDADQQGLQRLPGSNPMQLLNQRPGNYLGEFDGVDPDTLEPGNWYFDRRHRVLVYLVKNAYFFRSARSGAPQVRWAVRLDFADENRSSRYEPRADTLEGISLAPLEAYSWQEQEER